ncbi:MAG: hypothetical protein JWP73_2134, partial [Phenylobacterium sp.]|nr:hypothetical protein [Phenylobacterium sp.]
MGSEATRKTTPAAMTHSFSGRS